MPHKILPGAHAQENALKHMRQMAADKPGTRWAAYQNSDLGHSLLGHLQFLAIGPDRTYQTPPARLPDTEGKINWRYLFVGWVDLESGAVILEE